MRTFSPAPRGNREPGFHDQHADFSPAPRGTVNSAAASTAAWTLPRTDGQLAGLLLPGGNPRSATTRELGRRCLDDCHELPPSSDAASTVGRLP
ncbi:MAG: hypothetical protein ACPG4T_01480 [Nannocystaceae bacterium]